MTSQYAQKMCILKVTFRSRGSQRNQAIGLIEGIESSLEDIAGNKSISKSSRDDEEIEDIKELYCLMMMLPDESPSHTYTLLRAETGDCSHSSAAYYFRLGCREAEKSPHMEGWKPNSQHIRLAVTHTVAIKNDATFLPHTVNSEISFRPKQSNDLMLAHILPRH